MMDETKRTMPIAHWRGIFFAGSMEGLQLSREVCSDILDSIDADETKRIVEWLRAEAGRLNGTGNDDAFCAADYLNEAAAAFERGDHLKDKIE